MRQSSVAVGGSIARVPVCTLVLLCLAGVCQEPCHAAPRPRSSDRGSSSVHGGPRGLAKTVRPRGRTRTAPAYGDSDAWNTAVAEPSAPDGDTVEVTRRRELESLRQLLEGGKETLDQAVDREEQQREEEEEKERARSERDQMRRERAGEVAFLRSLAIRDAQGSFANLAGAASTAQNMQVGDVSDTAVPLTDREPSNTTTGDGSVLHRVDGPDVDQGGGVDNNGRKPSRWAKIMEEEGLSANVGADALDSMPEFDDLGSTMSAQANLHAEQVVQRAMLRLEQGLGQESMLDCTDHSATRLDGTDHSATMTAPRGEGGWTGLSSMVAANAPNASTSGHTYKLQSKVERRERRRQLLKRAMEEETCALRQGMVEAQMLAARAEGEDRQEHMQQGDLARAALVKAIAGDVAQGTLADVAEATARKVFGEDDTEAHLHLYHDHDSLRAKGEIWAAEEAGDEEALAAGRMRHARPFAKLVTPPHDSHHNTHDLHDKTKRHNMLAASTTLASTALPDASSLSGKGTTGKEERGIGGGVEVTVEFFADPACPWCYIARQQLDKALEIVKKSKYEVDVRVIWKPWLADQETLPPAEGQPLAQYIKQGSLHAARLMRLPGLAQGTAFTGWRWWPNSLQAQRLMIFLSDLGGHSVSLLAFDLLQRLTFEEGANISLMRVLTAVATELGLEDPVTFFRSKSHHEQILSLFAETRARRTPGFRIYATRYEHMGDFVMGADEEAILTALSDLVLALRRRQGLEEPLKWWTPLLEVDNPKYRDLGPMPNQYEMHA